MAMFYVAKFKTKLTKAMLSFWVSSSFGPNKRCCWGSKGQVVCVLAQVWSWPNETWPCLWLVGKGRFSAVCVNRMTEASNKYYPSCKARQIQDKLTKLATWSHQTLPFPRVHAADAGVCFVGGPPQWMLCSFWFPSETTAKKVPLEKMPPSCVVRKRTPRRL